jgi:hypothetical protein
MSRKAANLIALGFCVLFVLAGSLWIWRPSIQQDEALFAAGIYPPFMPENCVRLFKREVPLMVMTYVGTLKAVLYRFLVFPFFDPTAASVRIPALLIGAASVWLFFRLMLRTLGTRAALIGTALLATDVSYLLTIRWDWGPVALQHLCLIGGVLAIVRFWRDKSPRWLAAGFFIFGLGMWDKALFSWSIAALGIATIAVFPRFARELLKPRNAAIAIIAFLVGALPLLAYNLRRDWITFRTNTRLSTVDLTYKAALVWDTLEGSSLFGTIMRDDWDGPIVEPRTAGERAIVRLTQLGGMPRSSYAGWLLVLSLTLIPFARAHWRAIAFALIFSLVLWAQMASVDQGGTGTHHTVLLWPAPAFIVGAALDGFAKRLRAGSAIAVLAVGITCISNLLVIGTHYTNLIRNGAVPAWTEALWPVVDALKKDRPTQLVLLEWGFFDNVKLLTRGQLPLAILNVTGGTNDIAYARSRFTEPGVWFISHAPGYEMEPESLKRFLDFMTAEGFQPADVGIFNDLNGRPTIRVFCSQPK